MRRGWDRDLWAVDFIGSVGDRLSILGTGWSEPHPPSYSGEPSRALLFTTRALARAWCRAKQATYAGRTDSLAAWRFRPIRVREVVQPKTAS